MGITAAFFVGPDMVQIHEEIGPGQIRMETYEPGQGGYADAVTLARGFRAGTHLPQFDFKGMPPAPSPGHRWDKKSERWTDARTAGERAAQLQVLRDAAIVPRDEVLMALGPKDADGSGHLTEDEVLSLGRGEMPPKMRAAFSAPKDRIQSGLLIAHNEWSRNSPVAAALSSAFKIDDQTLDAAFNIKDE